MNADLTISTLAFKLASSSKAEGSERREVSRGVNLPEVMTIRHQEYTDSATKLKGIRSVVRFDRHVALIDGRIAPVSAYLVVAVPSDPNIGSADVLAAVERIAQVIQEDDSGLDLPDEIFVNKEQ
jgi:hypothetical protein